MGTFLAKLTVVPPRGRSTRLVLRVKKKKNKKKKKGFYILPLHDKNGHVVVRKALLVHRRVRSSLPNSSSVPGDL